ncbi:ScpA family protein [Tessaracoccus sp. OH4464_COT-324]|uniref:segregation and condensation protein A n=1 Tax=Tessaracoccus sp. OH4464_COT-324 TaxID=2491059 RepID=UPI000F63A932|nr:ScpA family protein [Tessaracoccus sp. OH4464_COT-324]RRD47527.1 segregation/condensation protein A [Tessaracoccus sp. OH4464_COT-324]
MVRPKPESCEPDGVGGFAVHLTNFEGPFDLLLQLIARRELDVTEVALSQVTDEFIAHVRAGDWDLELTSSFLVVAATLLDLKTARLLPGAEAEDPEDVAALEARDLLFARLLQYRAFKQLAAWMADVVALAARRHYRPGGLEERFRYVLPEVELQLGAHAFAQLAAAALTPKEPPQVPLTHLHGASVNLNEQVQLVASRLRAEGRVSFGELVAGSDRLTTVVRFLAVLELFRYAQVDFEQTSPLTELIIRWTAGDDAAARVVDEYGTEEAE